MKLLLDENLSRRLVPMLQTVYPGSSQVDLLGLSAHHGPPPLVIRLVMGNCSNARVLAALCDRHAAIMEILSRGRPVGVIELG